MSEPKPWMVEALTLGGSNAIQYETETEANQAAAVEAQKDNVDFVYIHKWNRLQNEWRHHRTVR